MNKYELALILKPHLDEDALKAEQEKVVALLERFGGTVEKTDDWGKRRLAYEIEKVTEGFYSFITFSSEPDAPAEIESRLRINENVLRYLIVRQED
jgi:small subunit ribosomal protein S6